MFSPNFFARFDFVRNDWWSFELYCLGMSTIWRAKHLSIYNFLAKSFLNAMTGYSYMNSFLTSVKKASSISLYFGICLGSMCFCQVGWIRSLRGLNSSSMLPIACTTRWALKFGLVALNSSIQFCLSWVAKMQDLSERLIPNSSCERLSLRLWITHKSLVAWYCVWFLRKICWFAIIWLPTNFESGTLKFEKSIN